MDKTLKYIQSFYTNAEFINGNELKMSDEYVLKKTCSCGFLKLYKDNKHIDSVRTGNNTLMLQQIKKYLGY
jgi:hypothetical protein